MIKQLTDKQRKNLKRIHELMQGGPLTLLKHISMLEDELDAIRASVKEPIKGERGAIGPQGKPGKDGKVGPVGPRGKDGESIIGPMGPAGKDGRDGERGENGKDGKNATILDISPQELRDLLELLQGDEKLSPYAIADLDGYLNAYIQKLKDSKFQFVGSPGSGGKVVQYYDLSASLDGSTTTFVLPAFWRIVAVFSSSSPFIFQPTTDYTFSGPNSTITFSSSLLNGGSINSGQTVIVLYAET